MKPRDIFGLAVRLLGLFFLYLGLKAVMPLLDWGAIESADTSDLLSAILPIAFNLAVAWWLLGGKLLLRRAYPETTKTADYPASPSKSETPKPETVPSPELSKMDQAEKRLASLVEKPKNDRATQP